MGVLEGVTSSRHDLLVDSIETLIELRERAVIERVFREGRDKLASDLPLLGAEGLRHLAEVGSHGPQLGALFRTAPDSLADPHEVTVLSDRLVDGAHLVIHGGDGVRRRRTREGRAKEHGGDCGGDGGEHGHDVCSFRWWRFVAGVAGGGIASCPTCETGPPTDAFVEHRFVFVNASGRRVATVVATLTGLSQPHARCPGCASFHVGRPPRPPKRPRARMRYRPERRPPLPRRRRPRSDSSARSSCVSF